MKLHLEGKRALVTGASKGLGYAVAKALLNEGASVYIASRSQDNLERAQHTLERETGIRPLAASVDLTQESQREALFESATQALGGVDLLLVNAGGPPSGPFLSHGQDHWRLAMDLSVGPLTHLCALAIPPMKKQGFGRIAQIVSIAGLEAMEGLILSHASRPAVLGLAKALAREVASDGILVNSICPGIFHTSRIDELVSDWAARRGTTPDDIMGELVSQIPLGRTGNPDELGDLAAFLLSPRNSYITGAAIPIDGAKTVRLY